MPFYNLTMLPILSKSTCSAQHLKMPAWHGVIVEEPITAGETVAFLMGVVSSRASSAVNKGFNRGVSEQERGRSKILCVVGE